MIPLRLETRNITNTHLCDFISIRVRLPYQYWFRNAIILSVDWLNACKVVKNGNFINRFSTRTGLFFWSKSELSFIRLTITEFLNLFFLFWGHMLSSPNQFFWGFSELLTHLGEYPLTITEIWLLLVPWGQHFFGNISKVISSASPANPV